MGLASDILLIGAWLRVKVHAYFYSFPPPPHTHTLLHSPEMHKSLIKLYVHTLHTVYVDI